MICTVKEKSANEVELVVDEEIVLAEKYRDMNASEIIDSVREKNTLSNKSEKSGAGDVKSD